MLGGLANSRNPRWGGIVGGAKGAAYGAGIGAGADYTVEILRCRKERARLDDITQRLGGGSLGAITTLSVPALQSLLAWNVQQRRISQNEAKMVVAAVAGMLLRIDMIDRILGA